MQEMFTTFFSRLRKTETKLAKSPFYLFVPQIKSMVSQQGRCLYGPLQHLANKRFDREANLCHGQSSSIIFTGTHNGGLETIVAGLLAGATGTSRGAK